MRKSLTHLLWLLLLLALNATPAVKLDYALRAHPIAADTYLLRGLDEDFSRDNGGNIANTAFIVTGEGVVVIDTGPSLLYGQQVRRLIEGMTSLPILEVINTHHHPDHFLGNGAFADRPIAALAGTREAMMREAEAFATNLYNRVGDWMLGTEARLPDRDIVPGERTIGGHRLRFMSLGGHTGADLAILDQSTGVLFAGDLVFDGRTPTTPHAHITQWLSTLDLLKEQPFKLLVPGHGEPTAGHAVIDANGDYLRWLRAHLATRVEQGASRAEVLFDAIPEPFAGWAVARTEYMRSVVHLYPDLERSVLGTPAPPSVSAAQ